MDAIRARHKPKEVDAIEIAKISAAAANGTLDMAPKWVRDAIFEKRLEVAAHVYGLVAYPMPNVPRLGAGRDWLLHDPIDDTVNVCPPDVFEKLYDVIPTDA